VTLKWPAIYKVLFLQIYKYERFKEEQRFTQQKIINLVKRMHDYSLDDLLFNQYIDNFDSTMSIIDTILNDYISPKTIRVYVINDSFKDLPIKSPRWEYMNTKYTEMEILVTDTREKRDSLPKLILPDLKCLLNANVCNFSKY